jgi:hypothetical protein
MATEPRHEGVASLGDIDPRLSPKQPDSDRYGSELAHVAHLTAVLQEVDEEFLLRVRPQVDGSPFALFAALALRRRQQADTDPVRNKPL